MKKKIFIHGFLTVAVLTSAVAAIAFFNAWTFAPYPVKYQAESGPRTFAAYVVSNGWHVGVIVPAGRINALLPELKTRFATATKQSDGTNYYEIGWGDQGFYEATKITTLMSLQAMFDSPGSVMHVVSVNNPVQAFEGSQITKFCLTNAQLTSLDRFIVSSFATDALGHSISRRPGLYGDSQFYKATGTYHFLNSCNTWVAKALLSAGFDISPTFKVTASQVMNNIDATPCPGAK